MQVKCPKCRFRYDTPVAAGITEIACVCPRCGTPFAHTITDDDLSQPSSDSLASGDGAAQTGRADGMHAVHTADGTPQHPNVSTSDPLNVATSQHPNSASSDQWIKHTIPAGKPQQGRGRRGCLRNCLIVRCPRLRRPQLLWRPLLQAGHARAGRQPVARRVRR